MIDTVLRTHVSLARRPARRCRCPGAGRVIAAFALAAGMLTGCAPGRAPKGSAASASAAAPALALPAPVPHPQVGPINHGSRSKPLVALTFDSNMTDFMLKELDRGKVASFDNSKVIDELIALHVPATIFLAGKWIERYPDEVRRLAAHPQFELASHSYAHLGFTRSCYGLGHLDPGQMQADVTHSEQLLRQYTDHPTRYFRFPGLCYDHTALQAIAPLSLTVVGADLASGDAFSTNVSSIITNTVSHARNGSIIVMHITGGNTAPRTADALPAIVEGLHRRGFTLVTVSTLLRG